MTAKQLVGEAGLLLHVHDAPELALGLLIRLLLDHSSFGIDIEDHAAVLGFQAALIAASVPVPALVVIVLGLVVPLDDLTPLVLGVLVDVEDLAGLAVDDLEMVAILLELPLTGGVGFVLGEGGASAGFLGVIHEGENLAGV